MCCARSSAGEKIGDASRAPVAGQSSVAAVQPVRIGHMFYRADVIDNVIGQARRLNCFVDLQRKNRAGEQSGDDCLHGLCYLVMSHASWFLNDGGASRSEARG